MSEKIEFFISSIVIVLVLVVGFTWVYFDKPKSFRIQNKYYAFELNAPKDWIAEENTSYTEDSISQILDQCKDGQPASDSYEVGVFRFEDQKTTSNISGEDGSFNQDKSSGILEISVSCMPNFPKDDLSAYGAGDLEIAGENAIKSIISLPQFGNVESISFFHNGLKYDLREYVYISSSDKGDRENLLRNSYQKAFSKIISSFKFIND
jgi:hypothetical protein